MNKCLPALVLTFFFMTSCAAYKPGEGWNRGNTGLQVAYLVSSYLDARQTEEIVDDPYRYETNPIMGQEPSDTEIASFFVGRFIVHTAVSYLLPQKWREAWQGMTLGASLHAVQRNGAKYDYEEHYNNYLDEYEQRSSRKNK